MNTDLEHELQEGFTLIEISIVLVIIGLIVGGVLAGQSLIRAAELRSVVTDQEKYFTAAETFRDKYGALPGDFSTATAIWGASSGCPQDMSMQSPAVATCNGDGDGIIEGDGTGEGNNNSWEEYLPLNLRSAS